MLLQTGGQAEHLRLLLPLKGRLRHPWAGVGEGAGLVKDDGVRLATASRNLPPLTVMCSRPASRMAESTARGMASFRAQEKSTISTDRARVTFRVRARLSRLPARYRAPACPPDWTPWPRRRTSSARTAGSSPRSGHSGPGRRPASPPGCTRPPPPQCRRRLRRRAAWPRGRTRR